MKLSISFLFSFYIGLPRNAGNFGFLHDILCSKLLHPLCEAVDGWSFEKAA